MTLRTFLLCAAVLLLPVVGPSQARAQGESLDLCLAAAADASCVYPTRVLPSPTTEVVGIYQVPKGRYQRLNARLIVVDVGQAIPPNSVISENNMQLSPGAIRGTLGFRGPELPLGKYRLDVAANDKPWKATEFTIATSPKPKIARPEELLSLREGKAWSYDSVRQANPGIAAAMGMKLDAEGKERSIVTLIARKKDATGTPVELRRGGELVREEWWSLRADGLVVTQRRKAGEPAKAAGPPQVILAWPLEAPKTWNYTAQDGSFKETNRMWGPFLMKGPGGDGPGYVVLTEHDGGKGLITTVERHFLVGLGLIRQVQIETVDRALALREDLTLKEMK